MTLVDTSSWVHQLRPDGDPSIRARVEGLLRAGQAAWCPQVRLELGAGARDEADRRVLRAYSAVLPDYAVTSEVWQLACDIGSRARGRGVTAAAGDLLIAACARFHGLDLEHADSDFDLLAEV